MVSVFCSSSCFTLGSLGSVCRFRVGRFGRARLFRQPELPVADWQRRPRRDVCRGSSRSMPIVGAALMRCLLTCVHACSRRCRGMCLKWISARTSSSFTVHSNACCLRPALTCSLAVCLVLFWLRCADGQADVAAQALETLTGVLTRPVVRSRTPFMFLKFLSSQSVKPYTGETPFWLLPSASATNAISPCCPAPLC